MQADKGTKLSPRALFASTKVKIILIPDQLWITKQHRLEIPYRFRKYFWLIGCFSLQIVNVMALNLLFQALQELEKFMIINGVPSKPRQKLLRNLRVRVFFRTIYKFSFNKTDLALTLGGVPTSPSPVFIEHSRLADYSGPTLAAGEGVVVESLMLDLLIILPSWGCGSGGSWSSGCQVRQLMVWGWLDRWFMVPGSRLGRV